MEQTDKNPEAFVIPTGRGKKRDAQLQAFSETLEAIQKRVPFKLSSRGWCYQLETFNFINKGQFGRVQKIINEARKKGFLAIDFVAEEEARSLRNKTSPTTDDPEKRLYNSLKSVLDNWKYHTPDYWEGEKYLLALVVEKVDLITIFEPVCKKYHIPIANGSGWSSILQRNDFAEWFKHGKEMDLEPVLLYFGDHDPFGLAISDYLVKNYKDIQAATKWNPHSLVKLDDQGRRDIGIDRFGLDYDFIQEHNLTWIDNLISSSGKKPDLKNPIITKYISEFGERKVEANAVVIIYKLARQLLTKTIEKYLGKDVLERFADKKKEIKDEYQTIIKDTGIAEPIEEAIKQLIEKAFKDQEKCPKCGHPLDIMGKDVSAYYCDNEDCAGIYFKDEDTGKLMFVKRWKEIEDDE